jgi:RNA polymerase sigma factor (sigma-70 family)
MAEPRRSAASFVEIPTGAPSEPVTPLRTVLVERSRAGDREAFEAIVAANLSSTFRTAMAILGSEADARDACQEAFLKAWRELPRLRDTSRFDAWLGRILVNACRTVLRTRQRRHVREIRVDDPAATHLSARGRAFDDRLGDFDALERAFDRLSVAERALMTLHYLDHRPLAEIGHLLGVPEGTVKSRLHAARRSFERALEVSAR